MSGMTNVIASISMVISSTWRGLHCHSKAWMLWSPLPEAFNSEEAPKSFKSSLGQFLDTIQMNDPTLANLQQIRILSLLNRLNT